VEGAARIVVVGIYAHVEIDEPLFQCTTCNTCNQWQRLHPFEWGVMPTTPEHPMTFYQLDLLQLVEVMLHKADASFDGISDALGSLHFRLGLPAADLADVHNLHGEAVTARLRRAVCPGVVPCQLSGRLPRGVYPWARPLGVRSPSASRLPQLSALGCRGAGAHSRRPESPPAPLQPVRCTPTPRASRQADFLRWGPLWLAYAAYAG